MYSMPTLTILLTYAFVGVFAAYAGRFLDFCLDYGHVLYRLRYDAARRAAAKAGMEREFDSAAQAALDRSDSFTARVTAFDALYWQVAYWYHPFTVWVCTICLCTRLSLYTALGTALLLLHCGYDIFTTLLLVAVAPVATFTTLRVTT